MSNQIKNSEDKNNYDKDLAKGEQAERNSKIHKKIDDIMEKKRLRYLLDESDDWEV